MTEKLTNPFTEGKPVATPTHLEKYIVGWPAQCLEHELGYVLMQEFADKHYTIYYVVFDLKSAAVLRFKDKYPVVTMQYMLRGAISYQLQGNKTPVRFEENSYRPLYIPAGATEGIFQKGITISLHFEFNEHYPMLFAKEFETLQELAFRLMEPSATGLVLPALPISYREHDLIHQELFTPGNLEQPELKQKYIIYNLFWLYHNASMKQHTRQEDPGNYREIVRNIKEEIRKRPNKELQSPAYFAKKYLITEPTLRRIFKAISGTTLADFRHEQCMRKACYLVAEGRLNLEEIALEIGYGGKSSLSIALKVFGQKSKQE